MIDIKFLEKLLELLNSSQAGAIEVRKNLWSTTIRVAKDASLFSQAGGPVTYQVAAPPNPPPSSHLPPPTPEGVGSREQGGGSAAPAAPAPSESTAAEVSDTSLVEIKSPMVGTFYAQPEPGAEPYVRAGTRVTQGQTLCIIEAMKIMNPIDAEVAGVIKEIAVQDAQPVEFGQVLFRVDTNA
jgi:acetyl-CoA carboxylase biotin carboxyl carrier protein